MGQNCEDPQNSWAPEHHKLGSPDISNILGDHDAPSGFEPLELNNPIPRIQESNALYLELERLLQCDEKQTNNSVQIFSSVRSILNQREKWDKIIKELDLINNTSFHTWDLRSKTEGRISEQFLQEFVDQCFTHMKKSAKKYPHIGEHWEKFKVEGSPALKLPVLDRQDFFIRVVGEKRAMRQSPSYLKMSLKNIIEWLILIDMAVLKDLKLVEPNLDQSSSNRELSNWLFDQAFKPQNSFPVFGMLETTHHLKPVKEFGRIQKILLEQLSRHDPEEDSLEASILIIQSWYPQRYICY
ncbi:uncharacterized protein PGTG_06547 [Puccinia graminis f. sp. tritici CRL 75-36-700-3]|uniref:Uncharacterized protein n=1 Tax=Puccinia graminis f. sp. tritici (strain CRL 75-36-700-3 / race SCCL) TaxID=418459 RepID=E3K8F1_PUCGT|nr:uncharacterized protein PGTG_06547 [Puccinia graminis f. sp. tritici CRL 75-36-700-3]EFP80591.2 hypothetical protein PGTG_06547 [Puccinia graminis f. sp. tritici CRL 75-36-700-3]